jgi:ABC-type oligopeptide transport system substrate-binding subunit
LAVLGQMLPQLFQVDPAGEVVGSLADDSSVAEMPGATGASFSLRRGVKWSDGTPITADDVRFTLEAVRGDAWPGSRAGYDRLTSVEGDPAGAAVTFRFDGPFPGWRRLFSGADFVLPAHRLRGKDLKAEWASGPDLSGGPFLLGAMTPGLEVVLDRNEQWWGTKAKLKSVHMFVVSDTRTMEQLLTRKELDMAWPPIDINRIGRFKAVSGVEVAVAKPGGRVELLMANNESLAQPQRAALFGLPDRDRFVDVLLAGEAERATTLAGPARAAATAAAGGPAWAQVKSVPDDRGREKGVSGAIVAAEEDEVAPLLGRVLESRAFVRGANLELKFANGPKVNGSWLPEGRFDLAISDTIEWPDPCWRCQFGDGSIGRGNVARVKGLEALAAAADRGDANGVAALEAKLRQDSVLLPLWRPSAVLAARGGMKGVVANSWSIGPFWRAENWSLSG